MTEYDGPLDQYLAERDAEQQAYFAEHNLTAGQFHPNSPNYSKDYSFFAYSPDENCFYVGRTLAGAIEMHRNRVAIKGALEYEMPKK